MKKYKQFIFENVQQNIESNRKHLEEVKTTITNIRTQAETFKSINNIEDLKTKYSTIVEQYGDVNDSMISTALSYLEIQKGMKEIEIRKVFYEEKIPTIIKEMDANVNDIVSQLSNMNKDIQPSTE